MGDSRDGGGVSLQAGDVTLALRGERIPLRHAVSSAFNHSRHELLVATPPALCLYGKMLTAGGDLLATLEADEGLHFQAVLYLPWLDAYSVIVVLGNGKIEHRIVSTDLKTSLTSHTIIEKDGQIFTALANPHRRELITADSDGGLKVWALRVLSTAQNNGGFKGVLRLHTAAISTRKPYYRHARMSFNFKWIFAATSTRVYVFDAASCNRLPCCLHSDHSTIFSLECGSYDNSVYLVFKDNLRKICKYSFMKKGSLQFRPIAEYTHDQDLAVFIENCQRPSVSIPSHISPHQDINSGNGVVIVDVCARLTIADFSDLGFKGRGSDSDDAGHLKLSAVSLPFNPLSERYHALCADTTSGGRKMVFVVWSTGFCILELFSPDANGRILCGTFDGDRLKKSSGEGHNGPISIYQSFPSAHVAMFEESRGAFRITPLQVPTSTNVAVEGSKNPVHLVDYVMTADGVVVLWPHGMVEKYNLFDNRVYTIAQPFTHVSTTASALVGLQFEDQYYVAVGDSMGAIHIFPFMDNDSMSNRLLTWKQAHNSDSVSTLCDFSSRTNPVTTCISLLSVTRSGEVKRWLIQRSFTPPTDCKDYNFVWDLLACFRTYSPDLSTARFESPDFLFCGFDGGSVECWKLPSLPENKSSEASHRQEQTMRHIAVVKRALHVIDLHLSPVLSILSEPGAGVAVATSPQPVADDFSWVFSYDEDAIILVWCFSIDFFFPHRRIKLHDFIKGMYISPTNGTVHLFAYTSRCIDLVDQLDIGDKEAVKLRLQRGKGFTSQRNLRSQEACDDLFKRRGGLHKRGSEGVRRNLNVPGPFDHVRPMIPAVPSVHIDITLPGVENATHTTAATPDIAFVKTAMEDVKFAQAASIEKPVDVKEHHYEASALETVLNSSPTRLLDRPASTVKSWSSRSRDKSSFSRKNHGKMKLRLQQTTQEVKNGFLPEENSLPSSFKQAKPRLYRNKVNPMDSLLSQARCTVISAGDQSSSPSHECSNEDSDLLPDMDDRHFVRAASEVLLGNEQQEKVSVVSLVEDEDESILLLDFQPGSRRPRTYQSRNQSDEKNQGNMRPTFEVPFMTWDRLSERDRRIELMAASKSRCVMEDAEKDHVFVPPVHDFESTEIPVQVGVRSFTRWFLSTHRHHQRIRERFLMEELLFAAIDPAVHQKLPEVGMSPPPSTQVGSVDSPAWQEFVSWYCLGITTRHQTIPPEVLQRERSKARTEYLELRLCAVAQSELEVQEEEEKAGPCEEEYEPPQRVFIFEHFVKRLLTDKDSPTSWENMKLETRQKEVMLALMDPAVQIAAMRNNIELPDVTWYCLEDFDIFALAGKFMPWWEATRNIHRRNFLKREAQEASSTKSILELLSKEQQLVDTGGDLDKNSVTNYFFESYFRSDTVRNTFLKTKLFFLRRKSRVASVTRYGKLPAPLVVETLPLPFATAFKFMKKVAIEEKESVELIEVVEKEEEPEEPAEVAVEQTEIDFVGSQRDQEEEELRRLEEESAKITLEIIQMEQEDTLSREYNNSFVESDDEGEEHLLGQSKRTDFSQSYFFGNLPVHYRKMVACGWRTGSGVNNGDEEFDEEEQLAREHERQRLLDEQEAERLLELERQAERARIEKEREERAFQSRRVRQAELKKVLTHQAELEAQRTVDLEVARLRAERRLMEREDEYSCWQRSQLLRDQHGMWLEDQLATSIRKEHRDAYVSKMRLLLHEQASMRAEDQRSIVVGKELQELEHQRAIRSAYLSELYTPFCPFFESSADGSEAFLPQLQWRIQREQLRRTLLKQPVRSYKIPLEEALVLDDLDQNPYLARDSRKFKLLMGLPLKTPNSQKQSRIPTADAIITMQQHRHRGGGNEEHQGLPSNSKKVSPLAQKLASPTRLLKLDSHPCSLPEIMPQRLSVSYLTDLKEVCRKRGAGTPTKRKANNSNQQHQQNQSLPFFRGNMLVQGQGQARSQHYAC